ncbi:MAG: bifunctional 2-polyprenyl-6-hydroxyphenol methylase/3-demethylubiquinol 3-O-methyltransferase UbiG [Halothiobacillaceae bacterium]
MSASADFRELEHFDRLAEQWWDPEGDFRALHDINPLRMEFILEHASLDGQRVLDVGCGGGILTCALAEAGAECTGIDLAADTLEAARVHAREAHLDIDYRLEDVLELAGRVTRGEEAPWDVVTCLEMLEHVPEPAQVVTALGQLVAPGGWVFLSTINRNPKSWLHAIVGAEYILRLVPRGTHRHDRFIRPAELAGWCRAAALDPRDIRGLSYNPVTRHYHLGTDVDVNYLMACRRAD